MNELKITPEDLERIENMILYYDLHGVERLNKKHPGFVEEDFKELLTLLNSITKTI